MDCPDALNTILRAITGASVSFANQRKLLHHLIVCDPCEQKRQRILTLKEEIFGNDFPLSPAEMQPAEIVTKDADASLDDLFEDL